MEQEKKSMQEETVNLELLEQALNLDSKENHDSFMLMPDKVC